jgi:hypothetical protein
MSVVHISVPDLISNTMFPVLAAKELGCFDEEGVQVDVRLHAGIRAIEEPVLADDDLPGLAEVRRRVSMPVATESDSTPSATSSSNAPGTCCSQTLPWSAD